MERGRDRKEGTRHQVCDSGLPCLARLRNLGAGGDGGRGFNAAAKYGSIEEIVEAVKADFN